MIVNDEYYVLYCTKDDTYLADTNFWINDINRAIRFKDIDRLNSVKREYSDIVVVKKVNLTYNVQDM